MQIVILAGGLGTRLRPIAAQIAKPMVPVAGRPFLEWQLESLASQGFRQVLMLVGYRAASIVAHFGDGARFGACIEYSREEHPLGTGGALRRALPRLDDAFLLLYGDSLLLDPIGPAAERLADDAESGIMAVHHDAAGATGVAPNVALDAHGRVARYCKDAAPGDLDFVEAGAVFLRAELVAGLPEGIPASLESELYPRLVSQRRLRAWRTRHPFLDIGTPERLGRAERLLAAAGRGEPTWI